MIRKINIGLRSMLAFGAIGLLVVLMSVFSISQINNLNDEMTVVVDHRIPALELAANMESDFFGTACIWSTVFWRKVPGQKIIASE